jgi:amidophosphoribosyltransferase
MPNQKMRQKGVRAKLNPMKKKFEGKNVLLVDDSIVRGTTSREIVLMAREAGAKKVIFTSCAPPITNAHIYGKDTDRNAIKSQDLLIWGTGIDLAVPSELLAHCRTPEAIASHIGADAVIYQTLPDLITACAQAALDPSDPNAPKNFEVGVFCGKYVTPVEKDYFQHLEKIRGKAAARKTAERARQMAADGAGICAADAETIDQTKDYFEHHSGRFSNHTHWQEALQSSPTTLANGLSGLHLLNGHGQLQVGGLSSATPEPAGTTPGALTDDEREKEETDRVKQSQDISLHNLNDYASP